MDFGDILEQWESTHDETAAYDEGRCSQQEQTQQRRPSSAKQARKMPAQRTLDLHGYTSAEAEEILLAFLKKAHSERVSKVLIIHGKGYHSKDGKAVLPDVVHAVLDRCSFAGMRGVPEPKDGGTGAVWVILR